MDITTSKLITLCYALFAVILCTLGYFFYQAQMRSFRPPQVDIAAHDALGKTVPAPGSQAISRRLKFEIERQRERIDELQTLLDKRESILERQASQLQNTTEEFQQVQQEADDYLDLLFEVIQGSAFRVNNLALLDQRTPLNSAGEEANDGALETLQVALEASQWELEQSIESATQSAATAATAEQRFIMLEEAMTDLGQIAVPTLVALLGDRQPGVRAWAAATLGKLGADATNAIDALNAAAEDPDDQVRAAATTSIQDISASW